MRLRAPSLDDAPAVLAVLEARDLTDLGVVEHRLADLLDEWRSSSFDLEADAIVAEADAGEVVAYATVQRPGTLVAVAPEHEREGIGTCLLAWAEQRERALGRARHRQWVAAYNARGHALLRGAGYQRIRSYWRLTRRLDGPVSPSAPPAGVALRPLSVGRDAVALHEVSEASFAANADYEPEPFGAFREKHLEAHDLDPGLSWVAERGALVAGFVLARRWAGEGTGYVDILAVHPAEQRCGLGTSLLTHAFVGFADAGLGEAQLGVASDNPRALRLYERAGMTQKFQVDTLERPATVAELSEKFDDRS
jgi:ribosomal protein S18 acetylase RimI-like enzyme